MIAFEELLAVAYKKERVQSRRLAKGAAISEHVALVKTLEKAAGGQSLRDLVDARHAAQTRGRRRAAFARERGAPSARTARSAVPRSEPSAWRGWFDGSALPNPGRLGIGGVLRAAGETVEISVAAGTATAARRNISR